MDFKCNVTGLHYVPPEVSSMKRRLEIYWNRDTSGDLSIPLQRYMRYLKDIGFRDSTIESYVGHVSRYLKFAGTDKPHIESAKQFRQILHERRLSKSSINNYSFSIAKYHEMLGEKISLPFLKETRSCHIISMRMMSGASLMSVLTSSTMRCYRHYFMAV